jgi:uncharacterized protein (TIGR03437 family)
VWLLATSFATRFEVRAQAPVINAGGVVNSASYAPPLAPGSLATAFGTFPIGSAASASSLPLPLGLSGLSLLFGNGQQAPLYYVSSGVVNFQVPWELAGLAQVSLVASANNETSAAQTVSLAPFAPAIFSQNVQGTGQGAIYDTTYRLVDASNPATAESTVVVIYATGLGAVSNQPASGAPSPAGPFAETTTTPVVTIGGVSAKVLFSGLEPDEVGVYQINALVPAQSATGTAVAVSISMGSVVSNTVTMAVGPLPVVNPTPSITSLAPFSASPGTSSSVLTVNGAGFLSSSTVTFNGINQTPTLMSASQLTITLTASDLAAPGAFAVTVANPPPGGGSSNTAEFIVQSGFGAGASSSTAWSNFARDEHHTAVSLSPSQALNRIHWSTPVDLDPQFTGTDLLIHYGSPLVTAQNTVIVPVKTGATSGFRVDAHSAANGTLQWSVTSDYILPPHNWVPEFSPALTPASRLYVPGAGGTVYYRDAPDSATGPQGQIAFYGLANYQANPQAYAANVMISTPITSDSAGNIYFGFQVTGTTPLQLQSGIARISATGEGVWIGAAAAAGDSSITEVAQNCAPALNESQGLVYVAVSTGSSGYLLALNSTTLQPVATARLLDPVSGLDATLTDEGSATPTVGEDGDVYYGVLENPIGENHYRGWLLHFDSLLAQKKIPGAFGWDDTASLVPSFMVPSYTGSSSYLLMTKYNDYAGSAGGTGLNRIAILDPNATESDPVNGNPVMNEVLTILGPTASTTEAGVREWCINSAAVDPASHSIFANSEDGKLYRWDLNTNTFTQSVVLSSGIGEAYTPTVIGVDGTVYAIQNSIVFAIGQ